MNLILLSKEDLKDNGNMVILTDRRYKHIRQILKSSIGDELCVGMVGGLIGQGRVLAIDDKAVEIEVTFGNKPPLPSQCTLILVMPRPIVLNRLLSHLSSMGIKKIVLIQSARVEKSYWKSPVLSEENIKEKLVLGLEQAKDTIMPEVICRKNFKTFVEDELPGIIKGAHAFVAHPDTQDGLPCGVKGASALVIGPEGGFLPDEIKCLEKAGCLRVNLGERILRVEVAVIAALSRIIC